MNPRGIPVARILGIEIRISLPWAFLIAVVTILGAEQAAATAPDLAGPAHWLVGGGVAVGFLLTVLAHELAHALVARRAGASVDSIVLGFVGGLAPLSLQAGRARDELLSAAAGPAVSMAVAVVAVPAALAIRTLPGGAFGALAGGLLVIGGLNLVLAAVSLLPGLPLDGGRIVRAVAWGLTGDRDRAGFIAARVGRVSGWAVAGLGLLLSLLDRFTEGLLVLALGWLLAAGSRNLQRHLELEVLLRGVPVEEAMRRDVPWVPPNLTVDTFAGRYEGPEGVPALPVVSDDRVVGVIGLGRLRRLGRRRFGSTRAADVMASPPAAPVLEPGDSLWDAVDLMHRQGLDALAVAEGGRLAGLLTRESIGEVVRRRVAARGGAG